MRSIHEEPFETFVDSWISQQPQTHSKRSVRKYVLKAIAMITEILNSPCCLGNTPVVYGTPFDNQLTLGLKPLLNVESFKGKTTSLTRTKQKLQDFLNMCC